MAAPIKIFLQQFFKQDSWKLHLLSNWDTIVGNLKNKMRIERIDGSVLVVGVYEASWLQELYMLSSVLVRTINQHLKKDYISRIKFIHATEREQKETLKNTATAAIKRTAIVLTKKERDALERIKDNELQKVLHTFLSRCHYQKIES